MKCVIIESPYAGEVEANLRYARSCLLDCLSRDEAPIASHLLYTQVLDDKVPHQRTLGIKAGLAWRHKADKAVFYMDRGLSPGMKQARTMYINEGIEIEERYIYETLRNDRAASE